MRSGMRQRTVIGRWETRGRCVKEGVHVRGRYVWVCRIRVRWRCVCRIRVYWRCVCVEGAVVEWVGVEGSE